MSDQAAALRTEMASRSRRQPTAPRTRVLAITSGKGGVGKTNTVANLAYLVSARAGRRALVFDADLGLANMDILLGITPRNNIADVISGQCNLQDVIVEGPGNIHIIPAGSGLDELTRLKDSDYRTLLDQVAHIDSDYDVIFIDTGAGISGSVTNFLAAAEEIIVVTTPEPTAFTDAYAVIKLLLGKYRKSDVQLLVNMAQNAAEAQGVHTRMNMMLKRFTGGEVRYLGWIPSDENLLKCIRKQQLIVQEFPASPASRAFMNVAKRMFSDVESLERPRSNISAFVRKFIAGGRS